MASSFLTGMDLSTTCMSSGLWLLHALVESGCHVDGLTTKKRFAGTSPYFLKAGQKVTHSYK